MTPLLLGLLLAAPGSTVAAAAQSLALGCTTLACSTDGGACDQQLGPAATNGEDATLGYDINAGTGNLFLSYADVTAQPALGPALVFRRYYNSQGVTPGVGLGNGDIGLGPGWTHSFSWQASMPDSNTVRIVTAKGRAIYFTSQNGDGQAPWVPETGEFGALAGGPGTGFTYTSKYGIAYQLDATANWGRLLSITPADSTAITISYSSGTAIASVSAGSPAVALTFSWSNGHIASITDPAGVVWSYAYDTSGNLSSVTYPVSANGANAQTLFAYSTYTIQDGTSQWTFSNGGNPNQLTGIQRNFSGPTFYYAANFSYAGSQVVTAASGEINQTLLREVTLSYTLCSDAVSTTSAALNGGTKTITSNPVSGLQRITEISATAGIGAGGEWTDAKYGWNADRTLASVVDGLATETIFGSYDGHGNPGSVTEAYGTPLARTTNYAWHPVLARPLSISRASLDGTHTDTVVFDYDADYDGTYNQNPTNFLHQIVEIGQTDTSMSGTLNSTVTETTQLYYDAENRITQVNRPAFGGTSQTLYAYYPSTAAAQEANRLQNVEQETVANTFLAWTYGTYDPDGRIEAVVGPNGIPHDTWYDPLGRVTATAVQLPDSGPYVAENYYGYDLAGNLMVHQTPDGNFLYREFDSAGRLWRRSAYNTTNPPTAVWSAVQDFDSWNRLVADRHFAGLGPDEGPTCSPGGSETFCRQEAYDVFGRLSMVKLLQAGSNDACPGNYCAVTRTYDADGALASITEPGPKTTSYARDALDRATTLTLPTGNYSTLAYDIDDDVISRRDPKDQQNGGSGGTGRVATFLYDDFGNRISISSPDTGTLLYNYDPANEETEAQDADGNQVTYQYDFAGRRTAANSPAANMSRTFLYDETGSIDGTNSYDFTFGRLTSVQARETGGDRVFTHYSFDVLGRTVLQSEERGPDGSSSFMDIRYSWGQNDEPLGVTYPDGEQVTYDYPTGATAFSPQPLPSELDFACTWYPGCTMSAASGVNYFPDGVVQSMTYANGDVRSLTRDMRGDWTELKAGPAGGTPVLDQAYGYDGNGEGVLTGVTHFPNAPNTWHWYFSHDSLHRLTQYETDVRSTATPDVYDWTYDEVGNRTQESYSGTQTGYTTDYAYDSAGLTSRLTSLSGGGTDSWAYDAAGRMTTHYLLGSNNPYPQYQYTYDALGRLDHGTFWSDPTTSYMDSVRNYDGLGRLWVLAAYDPANPSNVYEAEDFYDIWGRLITEYVYTGQTQNGEPVYAVTDHMYLGEGAGEVARYLQTYSYNGTAWQYGYDDVQVVYEDYRHGPFAISSLTNGLAWEVEENPFGEFMQTGAQLGPALPGPDGKIGTSDDLPALTSNYFATLDLFQDVDNLLTRPPQGGHPPFRTQFAETATPLVAALNDLSGLSVYAHPATPGSLRGNAGGKNMGNGGVNSGWQEGSGLNGQYGGGGGTLGYLRFMLGFSARPDSGGIPAEVPAIFGMLTGLQTNGAALAFGGGTRNFDALSPAVTETLFEMASEGGAVPAPAGTGEARADAAPLILTPSDDSVGQGLPAFVGDDPGVISSPSTARGGVIATAPILDPLIQDYTHQSVFARYTGQKFGWVVPGVGGTFEPAPDGVESGGGYPAWQAMYVYQVMHGGDFGDQGQGGGVVFLWLQGRSWEPGDGSLELEDSSAIGLTAAANWAMMRPGGNPL